MAAYSRGEGPPEAEEMAALLRRCLSNLDEAFGRWESPRDADMLSWDLDPIERLHADLARLLARLDAVPDEART